MCLHSFCMSAFSCNLRRYNGMKRKGMGMGTGSESYIVYFIFVCVGFELKKNYVNEGHGCEGMGGGIDDRWLGGEGEGFGR